MKLILSIFTLLFLFLVSDVSAQTTNDCQPLYGGGETCRQSEQISINKKILNSSLTFQSNQTYQDSDFVDHITTEERPYGPNQQTAFRLFITNTSNRDLTQITVEDFLPPRYITFVRGDGEYEEGLHTFSATIDRLRPDETRAITIQVTTAKQEDFPEGTGTLCTMNQALVTVGREVSEDNSQLCMNRTGEQPTPLPTAQGEQAPPPQNGQPTTKGGLPVEKAPQTQRTPDTGAEHLLILAPLAAAGFLLRRKIR